MLSSQIAQGSLLRGIAPGPTGLVRFHNTCLLLTWLLHGSLAKGEPCQVSAEFWVGCVPDAMAGGHPIPSSRTLSQPGWPLHECSVCSCSQGCWVRAMLQHSLTDRSQRSETCYQHCTSLTPGKELAQEQSSGQTRVHMRVSSGMYAVPTSQIILNYMMAPCLKIH